MNNLQKIFVMVAIGSIILWFITVFALGFDGQYHFKSLFKQGKKINWLGIFAILNIAVSVSGFFLFKDKK